MGVAAFLTRSKQSRDYMVSLTVGEVHVCLKLHSAERPLENKMEDKKMDVNLLLFDGFETLDAFGPIEILGRIEGFKLTYCSHFGGTVVSAQGARIATKSILNADEKGILVVPGGRGTRQLVDDAAFLALLETLANQAAYCLSICTGAALLAKCGALNGKKATSNKRAMAWVKSTCHQVNWVDKARWVIDGKYYTSSGVSAGMDMALGFVSDCCGRDKAEEIATLIEYVWNDDCTNDGFALKRF